MDVDQFMVCGASKRGWTTWLTGAVDSRVIGIAVLSIHYLTRLQTVIFEAKHQGGDGADAYAPMSSMSPEAEAALDQELRFLSHTDLHQTVLSLCLTLSPSFSLSLSRTQAHGCGFT